MLRLFSVLFCLFLSACGGGTKFDPKSVENDAGEAVLRQLFADCPHAKEAKAACIVLGPGQEAASADFQKRFENLGPRMLGHKEVTITGLSGKVRVHEKPRGNDPVNLVLLLQITEITGTPPNQRAVAAWAYKDDMVRRAYTIRQEGGKFTAQPGDILEQKSGETKK